MPSHNHSATLNLSGLTTSSAGAHTHGINKKSSYRQTLILTPNDYEEDTIGGSGYVRKFLYTNGTVELNTVFETSSSGNHTHTISGSGSVTIDNTGSGIAHENRPPYYALCYIMKL